jgi:predicted membrane-bound spermidine synthase
MLMPINLILLFLVFLSGTIALSIEIMAFRLVTPLYGNGVEQTSIIIAVVLLFISLGNYHYPKSKDSLNTLGKSLAIASLYFGVLFNFQSAKFLYDLAKEIGFNIYFSQIFLCFIVLGPISFIIGTIIPVSLKISSTRAIGKLIAISTLGAVSGALFTSLGLKYYFSLSTMIIINSILFLIICLLINRSRYSVLAIASIGFTIYINLYLVTDRYDIETGVATYKTFNIKNGKAFSVNGNYYSSLSLKDNLSSDYNNYIRKSLLAGDKIKDVLVLGAGGFSLSLGDKRNSFTYVDLDPKLKEIVKGNFNKDPIGDYYAQDARAFVNQNQKSFDLIVVDVFSARSNNVPTHLITVEFFRSLKESLNLNGAVALNIVHRGLVSSSKEAHAVIKGLNEVFGVCYIVPMKEESLVLVRKLKNTLAICINNEISTNYKTDNKY